MCGFDPGAGVGATAPVRLRELSCFSLRFAIAPPDADAKFSLSIGGLANEGRPVVAPRISFTKGYAWTMDALP